MANANSGSSNESTKTPLSSLPLLALYIHIPWCEKKCPYCDFNSHVNHKDQDIPEALYIEKLLDDLQSQLPVVQGRKLSSIFIGGGTPSLFSPASYQQLLQGIEQFIPTTRDIEITLEANPSSSEQEKFAGFQQAGINRLSIGVQSFNAKQLKALGRIHNPSQAITAAKAAKALVLRFNLDLMHGLPQQSSHDALADLEQAIQLGAKHISWYQLTIEQNTEFYRYPPTLPEEDILADIQDAGFKLLEDNGFTQYEISAFSQAGEQAKHNLNYWQYGDYLAIGAGAHGKVTLAENQEIIRFNNTRLPKDYLNRLHNYSAQQQTINNEDALLEALMNSLRLNNGMNTKALLERSFSSAEKLTEILQPLVDKHLVEFDLQENTKATELGRRYLNVVLEALI
jgi:oxygen-independent coproporphyrinogen-3 oxidase